ncbi:hypothetical protein [Rahnella variigena]|uniref:hypothetical protein n=1 Tax=Rahnella variigena TaxID=574964 RepID=UPI0024485D9E|nr:hypothetical protein [Rahnella variigena]MDH2898054.1 hypothetical protein [Rahnella variigena]
MNTSVEFKDFTQKLQQSSIEVAEGYASIEVVDGDVSSFVSQLKKFGIISEINTSDNNIVFKIGNGSFNEDSLLFVSIESLWRKSCSLARVPDDFFLIREKISSFDVFPEVDCMRQFICWRKVLSNISNHPLDNKSIWYLPDDDGGKEVVVELHDNLVRVKKIPYSAISLDSANKLVSVINLDDAQSSERKAILRKAVSDFVNDDSSIDSIVKYGERVYNRYNDLLDLYTKRFSVNKILSEIESKNLEYTTKINDFISSSQSKAFTIPGSLIAVGALAKTSGFWEGVLVVIGLWMVHYITKSSNDVQRESYKNLIDTLSNAFDRYNQFDEGTEVRKAAKNTLKSLSTKIDTASVRLDKIDCLGRAMIVISVIYLIFK